MAHPGVDQQPVKIIRSVLKDIWESLNCESGSYVSQGSHSLVIYLKLEIS